MRANWFIGLPVPGEDWFARVGEPPPCVRLFHPEDLHLTVAFLGAVAEARARRAFARASTLPLAPTQVVLGTVVPMGNPRHPSALSACLVEHEREVAQAIDVVRHAACDEAGARRDERPVLPHLTVARIRRGASRDEQQSAVTWAQGIDLGAPRTWLTQVALYTWSEDRKTRLFRIADVLPLPGKS